MLECKLAKYCFNTKQTKHKISYDMDYNQDQNNT